MRLEGWSRLLSHGTLALACLCLLAAESAFLPWSGYLAVPVLLLIAVAACGEGRWLLPTSAANLLGLAIGLGGTWWLLRTSRQGPGLYSLPLLTALVPYFGPVLIALLLIKLFRPRTPGDFWLLQGLGLLQVSLGCVLANDLLFAVLLAAWLVTGLACVALHHLCQQIRAAPAPDLEQTRVPFTGGLVPFLAFWTLLVSVLGGVLFLLAPRGRWQPWDPHQQFQPTDPNKTRAETGFSETINLKLTGPVEVSNEIAFQVRARRPDGRTRPDLPPGQRWRGIVLVRYSDGIWETRQFLPHAPRPARQTDLPDFGPNAWLLDFRIPVDAAGGVFLAEPVRFGPPGGPRLPFIHTDGDLGPLFFESPAGLLPLPRPFLTASEYRYRQIVPRSATPDLCPLDNIDRLQTPMSRGISYLMELKNPPSRELSDWTSELVRRLANDPHSGLRAADADPVQAVDPEEVPANAVRVARALTRYLSTSSEFSYTLDLQRSDPTLDPVLDFLKNVRAGHCERYASALVLMLRARGIPARLIKGFRGAEAEGEGVFVVRKSHAHAWVEALVPREGQKAEYDWLTLDPTPAGEMVASSAATWPSATDLWRDLVLTYSAERQAALWQWLFGNPAELLRTLAWLAILAGVGGLLSVAWLWLRRLPSVVRQGEPVPEAAAPALACLARLLNLLRRSLQLGPRPGQTPREFADDAARMLLPLPAAQDLADLPGRVVAFYYRVRFGEEPATAEEVGSLERELDQLAAVLTVTP